MASLAAAAVVSWAIFRTRPCETRPAGSSRVRSRFTLTLSAQLLAACLLAGPQIIVATAVAASAPLVGRSLADVLAAVRADGIVIVFNTQVVPQTLRVLSEPVSQSGLPMLREILAPHGLGLIQVGQGAYAVTQDASLAAAPSAVGQDPAISTATRPHPLEEVVVTTSRFALGEVQPGSHTLLSGEVLQTLPRLGEETLKAVQRLPGVAANGFAGQSACRCRCR